MRRVVVTGLGLVTPLGGDVETTWKNILASKSGAGPITRFDASDQKCRIACEVKPADHEYGFDASKRVDHKVQRQVDPFIIFGIDAAGQAFEDAGLTDMPEEMKRRAGCWKSPVFTNCSPKTSNPRVNASALRDTWATTCARLHPGRQDGPRTDSSSSSVSACR